MLADLFETVDFIFQEGHSEFLLEENMDGFLASPAISRYIMEYKIWKRMTLWKLTSANDVWLAGTGTFQQLERTIIRRNQNKGSSLPKYIRMQTDA